jgi:HAMP domain-containing protein
VLSAISFLIIHPDFSLGLSLNIVLIGLAMGQAIFAIIYFFSRRILADITHILYSFGDITSPNKTLGIKFKIMISAACPGVFFVSTYLALLLSFLANRINFSLFSMGIVLNSILSFVIMYIISSGLVTGLLDALKEIKRGIEIVQSGSLQNRINVKTGDEIESVAYEFNIMTDYLEKRCK